MIRYLSVTWRVQEERKVPAGRYDEWKADVSSSATN